MNLAELALMLQKFTKTYGRMGGRALKRLPLIAQEAHTSHLFRGSPWVNSERKRKNVKRTRVLRVGESMRPDVSAVRLIKVNS